MSKQYSSKNKLYFLSGILGLVVAVWCCQLFAKPIYSGIETIRKLPIQTTEKIIKSQLDKIRAANLDRDVLKLALTAYHNAKKEGIGNKNILTVVDYSLASTQRRMWVIDMNDYKVLYHTHVSHGIASGDNYARRFSNRPGSRMSSIGMMVTGDMYSGQYGSSLNLYGLEDKYNSNAYSRRIVMHPAHYVDESIARRIGRLGRSLGCLALNKRVAFEIMQAIKGGSFIFCYYPDKNWLRDSTLLKF